MAKRQAIQAELSSSEKKTVDASHNCAHQKKQIANVNRCRFLTRNLVQLEDETACSSSQIAATELNPRGQNILRQECGHAGASVACP